MPNPKLVEAILRALAGAGKISHAAPAARSVLKTMEMLPGRGRALPRIAGTAMDVGEATPQVARGAVRTAETAAGPVLPELRMAGEGLPAYPGRVTGRGLIEELSDVELADVLRRAESAQAGAPGVPVGDIAYRDAAAASAESEGLLRRLADAETEWGRRFGSSREAIYGQPSSGRMSAVGEWDQFDAGVLEGAKVEMPVPPGPSQPLDMDELADIARMYSEPGPALPTGQLAKREALLKRFKETEGAIRKSPKGAEKAIREAELPPMQKRLLARAGKPNEKFKVTLVGSDEPVPGTAILLNDGTVIGSTRGPKAPVPHTDLVLGPRKKGFDYLDNVITRKRMASLEDFMDEGGVRLAVGQTEHKRSLYVQCAEKMTDEQIQILAPRLKDFEVLILDTGRNSVAIAHPTAAKLRVALRLEGRKSLPGLAGLYS